MTAFVVEMFLPSPTFPRLLLLSAPYIKTLFGFLSVGLQNMICGHVQKRIIYHNDIHVSYNYIDIFVKSYMHIMEICFI